MKNLKTGFVFSITLPNDLYLLGQIYHRKGKSVTVVVFEEKLKLEALKEVNIETLTPFLLVRTFTAKFKVGDWNLLYETNIYATKKVDIKYKVEQVDGTYLVDYEGNILKKLNWLEARKYFFETHVSPMLVETAMLAHFEGKWDKSNNGLLFKNYVC